MGQFLAEHQTSK